MGIFKDVCYGVQCDGCKEVHVSNCLGFSIFVDEYQATNSADDDDWKQINGKWYCPECVKEMFKYNEETDEYELVKK